MAQPPKFDTTANHHALIGRVMLDNQFRQDLIDDPKTALAKAGIQLPPADVARFTSMTKAERQTLLSHVQTANKAYLDNIKVF